MRIGLGLANKSAGLVAEAMGEWAGKAEDRGFDFLGTNGRAAYPGVVDTVALAVAAAVTTRVELLPSLIIAPSWPPELLAIELAGIDAVSGGRLTVGLGLGVRPDDYPVSGLGPRGVGARLDHDLPIYRAIWRGERTHDAANPYVPVSGRELPLLFGGNGAPAAFLRMARWGTGYIAPSIPATMAAPLVAAARDAWTHEGRQGQPRIVGIAYSGLSDPEAGRASIAEFYAATGEQTVAIVSDYMSDTAQDLRNVAEQWRDIGADDLLVLPARADIAEIDRVADALL